MRTSPTVICLGWVPLLLVAACQTPPSTVDADVTPPDDRRVTDVEDIADVADIAEVADVADVAGDVARDAGPDVALDGRSDVLRDVSVDTLVDAEVSRDVVEVGDSLPRDVSSDRVFPEVGATGSVQFRG